MKKPYFILSISVLLAFQSYASGIKGTIRNTKNELLPFASIMVKGSNVGTMANEDARYELSLKPGRYEVIFQYLGHKTLQKTVDIQEDTQTLDVKLEEVSISLGEVKIANTKEDAANTIMRKAISMAKFHLLEVDSYTARTYVKGTFRILDIPFLLKGAMKEAKMEVGTTYVLESINDISVKQPNVVKEKIISTRSNLPPGAKPAISFARFSFYSPEALGVVSPLSPKAFGYYKFEYQGYFEDRGLTVNKIRVIPRSRGQNVFNGYINIIEGTWSIHSLSANFTDENGFDITAKQVCSPIEDVWVPVNLDIGMKISYLGAKAEMKYVTSVRNYDLKVNSKYHQQPTIIDEKIDKQTAIALKEQKVNAKTALAQKELTRKQLKKLQKEMEKEDIKERKEKQEDVAVIRDYTITFDTLARKRNDAFWNEVRQVPLTDIEVKSYTRADSIYKANEPAFKKDSIKNLPKFKASHLLLGHIYNYGKDEELYGHPKRLSVDMPLTHALMNADYFNTVEGYVAKAGLEYYHRFNTKQRLRLNTNFRYGIGNQRLSYVFSANRYSDEYTLTVNAGNSLFQYNQNNPISEAYNTSYSLWAEQNFLKFFQKSFAEVNYTKRLTEKFTFRTGLAFEERNAIVNTSPVKSWRNIENREFEPNIPQRPDLTTPMQSHQANIWSVGLSYRPVAKAGIFNGRKYTINNNSPVLRLQHRMALGTYQFRHIEASISDEWEVAKGKLSYLVRGGAFYGNNNLYFVDYKHFNGNQTIFQSSGLDRFRMMPYYTYSTTDRYLEAYGQYDFRQFLVTQIPALRLYGISEYVFANALSTPQTSYIEVGYGLTGILKSLGFEVVAGFGQGQSAQFGARMKTKF